MRRLSIISACAVGPIQGDNWPTHPHLYAIRGGMRAVTEALQARYSPLKLRRLDAYVQTALLAAKMTLEAVETAPDDLGLIVCTGLGPIPSTNAFMDSYLDFGAQGASPTAFSQTVHNLAASSISMFMGLCGPALTVSQPGLGLTSALLTARSWLDQGLAKAVLLGAVDDGQAFSNLLYAGQATPKAEHDPVAVFTLVTEQEGNDGIVDVLTLSFSSSETDAEPESRRHPGPAALLSSFFTLPAEAEPDASTLVKERRENNSVSVRLQPRWTERRP